MRFEIRNWSEFQHYKNRNPPWIKLHYEILTSQDWVLYNDASKVLAVVCMLLASRNDGIIDGTPDGLSYIQRVAYLTKPPNLKPLIDSGFLIPIDTASKALASASVSVSVSSSSLFSEEGGVGGEKQGYENKPYTRWTDEEFKQSIRDANKDDLLTQSELGEFFSYWTEKDPTGRPLYKKSKTWDTRRRMQTGFKLIYSKNRPKPENHI